MLVCEYIAKRSCSVKSADLVCNRFTIFIVIENRQMFYMHLLIALTFC